MSDESGLTAAQERNKRLAERIAAGSAVPGLNEVMKQIRLNGGAYLDVPGPRAVQLCDEIDRLRRVITTMRDFAADELDPSAPQRPEPTEKD